MQMAANSIPLNLEILYGIQTGLKKVGEHFIFFLFKHMQNPTD